MFQRENSLKAFLGAGPRVGDRLEGLRSQVEEVGRSRLSSLAVIILLKVTGVMRGNIGAVLNRGNNLSELQDRFYSCRNMKKSLHPISKLIVARSEWLNTSSDLFRSEASRLRRNASDLRLRVGLGVGLVVVVVVIIIISTL